jgi:hypothetical protein
MLQQASHITSTPSKSTSSKLVATPFSFLAALSKAAGVKSSGFDEDFYAYHQAWLGLPSITISLERLNTLPQELATISQNERGR